MSFQPNPDWIPCRFFLQQDQPKVEWCYLGRRRFKESFFEGTLHQCMRLPFNTIFRQQTPVETLLEWHTTSPGIPPTGFIFHMSRCGSTLVSQMLATLPQNIVLSEPAPFDELLSTIRTIPTTETERIEWLRAMVSALGQRRYPEERRLFIKFDSFHTQDLPLIRAAFPETPWIFLFRDPREVMVSQMKSRGFHLVPSPADCALFGIDPAVAYELPPERYSAFVLASILGAALAHQSVPGGRLVNYTQLPQAVTTSISDHFGVTWSADEVAQMQEATQYNAKSPGMLFTDDRHEKQRAVTEAIACVTKEWLIEPYERLEALRVAEHENRLAPREKPPSAVSG